MKKGYFRYIAILLIVSIFSGNLFTVYAENKPFAGKNSANIVYLGGSITVGVGASATEQEPDPYKNDWVTKVGKFLETEYPDVSFNHYKKGMGGTGSNYGILRFKRDVISCDPDMLFIEFAVNDFGQPQEDVKKWLESMILTLEQECEEMPYIMFVLTSTLGDTSLLNNETPHKAVANYYKLPCADTKAAIMATGGEYLSYAATLLNSDKVHPNNDGYAFYAQCVIDALKNDGFKRPVMQETLLNNKSDVVLCNFNPASGYSHSENWTANGAILETSSLGETITAEFTGKVAAVSSYIFPQGGKYTINIDGEDVYTRDSYTEVANQAGLAYVNLDLEDTKHTLKITTTGASSSAVAGTSQKIDYLIFSAPKEDIVVTDFSLAEEFNDIESEADSGRALAQWKYSDGQWVTTPVVKDGYLNMSFGGARKTHNQYLNRRFDSIFDVKNAKDIVLKMKFKTDKTIPQMEAFPTIAGGAYEGRLVSTGDKGVYKVRTTNNSFYEIGDIEPDTDYTLEVVFNFKEKTRDISLLNETTGNEIVCNDIPFQNDVEYLIKVMLFGYASGQTTDNIYIDYLRIGR